MVPKHFNRILVILSYTVNCFPPLIRDKESGVKEDDDVTETNADIEAMIRDIRFPDLEVGATETVGEDNIDTNDVTETNADIDDDDFEAMFWDDWH